MNVRPLVVRFGALGDMILLTSLLRGLREVWGRRCDVVVPEGPAPEIFEGLDSVGTIWQLKSRRLNYLLSRSQQKLVGRLRLRDPSPVYVADRSGRTDKLDWLLSKAGVPRSHIIGPQEARRGDLEHVVHYFGRMRRLCPEGLGHLPRRPAAEADPEPELALGDEEVRNCARWLARRGWTGEPLVFFQTQSRRSKRGRWPAERWVEAIRQILEWVPEGRALLLGSAAEREPAGELAAATGHDRLWNLAGELPLRRLFALLSLCHSGVSLDSGPAHAAAALDCPVVVLNGQADPRRNLPVGPPGRVQSVTAAPRDQWPPTREEWEAWHQLSEIRLESVLEAWRRLDPREGPGRPVEGALPEGDRRV